MLDFSIRFDTRDSLACQLHKMAKMMRQEGDRLWQLETKDKSGILDPP